LKVLFGFIYFICKLIDVIRIEYFLEDIGLREFNDPLAGIFREKTLKGLIEIYCLGIKMLAHL